jgi:hypothetical protein
MSSEAMILKRDAGGRVMVPLARQIELVREYERSGLSGPKLAAVAGLSYQTFATWRRKHGSQPPMRTRPGTSTPSQALNWMEALVDSNESLGGGIALLLPGGAKVELTRPEQAVLAAELLKAITSLSC